jgi:hypothetical protein
LTADFKTIALSTSELSDAGGDRNGHDGSMAGERAFPTAAEKFAGQLNVNLPDLP